MYKNLSIAVVIPAYNEEKLIGRTIETLPASIDEIIVVNDKSKDDTLARLHEIAAQNKKVIVIDHEKNLGVGGSLVSGYKYFLNKSKADLVGIVSADAQCDPGSMEGMIDELIRGNYDYVKGNRFYNRTALRSMPLLRKLGNIFISVLTKFSTGYYSISDTQMGFGFIRRQTMERIDLSMIRYRYDYENSMLIALSIVHAKLKDYPVPAIYGEETSTIDFWPTVLRTIRTVWVGFWKRVYYKYILYSFHPVALFLFSGLVLFWFGVIYALVLAYGRFALELTPSTGTLMIAVLPILLGFQLLLTAVTLDINNEPK